MPSETYNADWEEDDPDDAREVYEKLLDTLDHNTGGYQPPLAKQSSIVHGTFLSGFKITSVKNALSKARQDGELFRWQHPDGTRYIGVDDPDALRAKTASYAQRRDDLRTDLIGVVNQRIDHHEQ